MPRRIESLFLAGPAGRLEAVLEEPEDREPSEAALVCHPHPKHGGTMHNKVVYRIAHGLRRAGIVVLRFNFRGVGKSEGEHGHMAGEIEDARAALEYLRGRYPYLPYALAGFSFGARTIMMLGCGAGNPRFLLAAGFSTRMGSWDFLGSCTAAKLFLHSTHDEYGPRADFERLYAGVADPKQLVWIEASNHFFAGALEELEERVFEAASAL
jgi:uncharacterized protein